MSVLRDPNWVPASVTSVFFNFDINTDAGATFTSRQVRAATTDAREGSICIGHFNRPGSGTAQGISEAIEELTLQGMSFTTLGDALA